MAVGFSLTVVADESLLRRPDHPGRPRAVDSCYEGGVLVLCVAAAGVALTAQASFEVASIRRSDSLGSSGSIFVRPGGVFSATNISALNLIGMAYRVPGGRVLDAPGWATDERYVIEARAPPHAESRS